MQQISADFHDVFTGEGKFEKKLHLELDANIEPVTQPVRRIPLAMKPKLRWLEIVSSTYIVMGRYNHSLSLDATTMVSKNCPTIGEHVVTIFVTQ